ncbi:MAG: exodeoxyribonuclease V subunit gamma, partial [Syntrophobacteria bacterium]
MAALRLYSSNRMEVLVEVLAEVLSTPPASPFDREIIIVQSNGMARWVCMELARRHGICANYSFPFPNSFVHEMFRKVFDDLPDHSPFDPKILTWKIVKVLPSFKKSPGFEGLNSYLGESGESLRCIQLAERIADTFDQYLLFRPEMILRWEKGEESHWQAVLWRELVKDEKVGHRASLGKPFLETLEDPLLDTRDFPERVSIFGISALPRFHVRILAGLSRFADVNLFLMNPCKEYWGDILPERALKAVMQRGARYNLTPEELHLEKGNSLLASMGVLGRDFWDLVNEFTCEETLLFEDPGEKTLLACIQSDILNLRDAGKGAEGKKALAEDDESIQIHSCHNPMREVEVLYDQLLDLFEKDPTLSPRDILVMTPDIEAYSPYIQAVFDVPGDDPRCIPFTIADRSIRKEGEIIDTFLGIFDLYGGRFAASQILSVLESPPVRRKFDLEEADLELIFTWVKDTRIRWGIDGESRSELGLPAFEDNTWKAGLERLLLGYAMPGQDQRMFGEVLPYDHIEGSQARALGKLLEFAQKLFTHVRGPLGPRSLSEWSKILTELLEAFFLPDEDTEGEMQVMRRLLKELGDTEELSGFHEKVDSTAVKWYLGRHLEREGFGYGFMSGGVTFCAMLPMRSIPFSIICLLGMNGGAYPRQSKPLGFDLLARDPRPGDRSRRNDDRYLFLEAILSAREKLYMSYVGQSIQDTTPMPPSVLVSELTDYIEQGFHIPGGKILDHIFRQHRLQAFSPAYFTGDGKLFSYSDQNLAAARRLVEARKPPEPFIAEGLSQPGEEWKSV